MRRPRLRITSKLSVVWLHAQPLALHKRYLLKHASHVVPARVRSIRHRIDIETLEPQPATTLDLNGIGMIEVATDRPIIADLYDENRATGSFILIDAATNATVGAGMIRQILASAAATVQAPRIVAGRARADRRTRSATARARLSSSAHARAGPEPVARAARGRRGCSGRDGAARPHSL